MKLTLSHEFIDESLEEKTRWFATLTVEEREECLCRNAYWGGYYCDSATILTAYITNKADARAFRDGIGVLSKADYLHILPNSTDTADISGTVLRHVQDCILQPSLQWAIRGIIKRVIKHHLLSKNLQKILSTPFQSFMFIPFLVSIK